MSKIEDSVLPNRKFDVKELPIVYFSEKKDSEILNKQFIKNTTKQIEDEIFTVKENIRVLQSEFENISLSYGDRLILDNINFKINHSEIFGMLGPNGVGKSTIFNLITGLINPSNGKIKIDGEEVNEYPIYLRAKKFKIGYR